MNVPFFVLESYFDKVDFAHLLTRNHVNPTETDQAGDIVYQPVSTLEMLST